MKKITLTLILFLMLTNCGYKALYSNKNLNLNIIKIEKIKKNKLNLTIEKRLNNFSNKQALNKISLKIDAEKEIKVVSKNMQGNPSRYQMIIKLNIDVIDDQNKKINKNITQDFSYNTNSNRFTLSQYEIEIEEVLINKIIDELIKDLSKL
ncbi:LPS assembly lipoprotein LptE [Candidatus Pelagibacter sp. Uisw_121]|uniref:LPS assembly lipoprotein LptE n=1 Tax=Candidatus Pelagibacter sp. Uisw_121 TaxID=3230987 RepID=UPI0039E8CC17